jgi:gluconokinase
MRFFIGVDIGTTSTKAIVFSAAGRIKGISSKGYEILVPQPDWAEQDPAAILAAVIAAVREAVDAAAVAGRDIAAVGFSAATHSLIALDADHQPLTKSLIWADNRSLAQAERLKQSTAAPHLYRRTGSPIHPVSVLTKLMWLRESEPQTFSRAAKFVSVKEYVFYHLFKQYIVDYSIASATGLLNIERRNWDEEALTLAGISRGQLSELVPTTHVVRGLQAPYAEAMGLAPDVPVVVGANDGALANVGVGAVTPGECALTIGTSGAVRTVTRQPIIDPQARTFCYALTENHWVIGGPTNNGGIVLRWLRDQFCAPEVEQARRLGVEPYEVMIQAAAQVPAGAEGLLCLPYLSGERAPYWNAKARGVFYGMGLHHQRAHFIRAVLEGILFNVYSVRVALQEVTGAAGPIRISGGFARSPIWRQMLADLFGAVVLMPEVYEASGYGAAVLAMHAVGAMADVAEVLPTIRITAQHQPDVALARFYHRLFTLYHRLYDNVAEEFNRLAEYRYQAMERL